MINLLIIYILEQKTQTGKFLPSLVWFCNANKEIRMYKIEKKITHSMQFEEDLYEFLQKQAYEMSIKAHRKVSIAEVNRIIVREAMERENG